jgi:hypothetical protein
MKSLSLTTQSIFSFLSQFLIKLKHEEDTSQINKTESTNDDQIHSCQADAKKRIQHVQENYFLERRNFL